MTKVAVPLADSALDDVDWAVFDSSTPSTVRVQRALPSRYLDATQDELGEMISAAKQTLGERLLILGHHYQRPEVIRWADYVGDSFGLSKTAAELSAKDMIVFCGVHFMAESADILTEDHQVVVLPDLNAGCSMADMADLEEVQTAWLELSEAGVDTDFVVPITYMNSSAAIKAFVGKHGGAVCTSSNARAVLEWALAGGATRGRDAASHAERFQVLFFPDQHLGRNTALNMGFSPADMAVWDPRRDYGGLEASQLQDLTFFLWKGHCSVHQRFKPEHVQAAREKYPEVVVVVHPECDQSVVRLADEVGSTEYIRKTVENAPQGAILGIGTEIHMVQRLAAENPDKTIFSIDPLICPCSTMSRIDAAHLAWCLEALVRGEIVNQIEVDEETTEWSKVALDRMLQIV